MKKPFPSTSSGSYAANNPRFEEIKPFVNATQSKMKKPFPSTLSLLDKSTVRFEEIKPFSNMSKSEAKKPFSSTSCVPNISPHCTVKSEDSKPLGNISQCEIKESFPPLEKIVNVKVINSYLCQICNIVIFYKGFYV